MRLYNAKEIYERNVVMFRRKCRVRREFSTKIRLEKLVLLIPTYSHGIKEIK